MQRGTTGNDQHPTDWERQREQLSAYLDDQLDPADRATLEAHLATCPACQAERDDLRALRAVLRAMPAPTLPRSFLLPEEGDVPQPISARRAATPSPAAARSRRRGLRVVEWAGALAAAIGLALLLGSALASTNGDTATPLSSAAQSTTSGAQTTVGTPTGTNSTYDQSHTPATANGDATVPSGTPNPASATSAPTYATDGAGKNAGHSVNPSSSNTVPPILPIGGASLFVGGAVVFVVGRNAARRQAA